MSDTWMKKRCMKKFLSLLLTLGSFTTQSFSATCPPTGPATGNAFRGVTIDVSHAAFCWYGIETLSRWMLDVRPISGPWGTGPGSGGEYICTTSDASICVFG